MVVSFNVTKDTLRWTHPHIRVSMAFRSHCILTCCRLSLFSAPSVFSLVEFPHFIAGSGSAASHKVVLRLRMGGRTQTSPVHGAAVHVIGPVMVCYPQEISRDLKSEDRGHVRFDAWIANSTKPICQAANRDTFESH